MGKSCIYVLSFLICLWCLLDKIMVMIHGKLLSNYAVNYIIVMLSVPDIRSTAGMFGFCNMKLMDGWKNS